MASGEHTPPTTRPVGQADTIDSSQDAGKRAQEEDEDVDLSGMTFANRYKLVRILGRGGMGEVYLADHTVIPKQYAVKVLSARRLTGGDALERFMQEARTASSIRHPNVVEITDFGFSTEGLPYLVMEYLDGEELATLMKRDGPLPWPRVRAFMLQLLEALHAAHQRGVIHRDVKPQNCIRLYAAEPGKDLKVLDFGLAKVIDEELKTESLTETGVLMGTVHYMSPEQARSEAIDARTDIYSAGVVAYQMLTGQLPFQAPRMTGVLSKLLIDPVPAMADAAPGVNVPAVVEDVVVRAMAKNPDHRYASAAAFAEAIRSLPEDPRELARMGAFPWRMVALAVGLVVVLLITLRAIANGSAGDGPDTAGEEAGFADVPEGVPVRLPPKPEDGGEEEAKVGTVSGKGRPSEVFAPTSQPGSDAGGAGGSAGTPSVAAPPVEAPSKTKGSGKSKGSGKGKGTKAPAPSDPPADTPSTPGATTTYTFVLDAAGRSCDLKVDDRRQDCGDGRKLYLTEGGHELRWRFSGGAWQSETLTVQPGPRRCLLLYSDAAQVMSGGCPGGSQ